MDIFSKENRSEILAAVKGRGNMTTEIALIKILRKEKITGYRHGRKAWRN